MHAARGLARTKRDKLTRSPGTERNREASHPSSARRSVAGLACAEVEDPIRAELFGVERLEQHAASLAVAQQVTGRRISGRRLTNRLRDNGRVLLNAYRTIGEAIRDERAITPAAEWLVDNFHVVEEQRG